jgi:hypothetical protein
MAKRVGLSDFCAREVSGTGSQLPISLLEHLGEFGAGNDLDLAIGPEPPDTLFEVLDFTAQFAVGKGRLGTVSTLPVPSRSASPSQLAAHFSQPPKQE